MFGNFFHSMHTIDSKFWVNSLSFLIFMIIPIIPWIPDLLWYLHPIHNVWWLSWHLHMFMNLLPPYQKHLGTIGYSSTCIVSSCHWLFDIYSYITCLIACCIPMITENDFILYDMAVEAVLGCDKVGKFTFWCKESHLKYCKDKR